MSSEALHSHEAPRTERREREYHAAVLRYDELRNAVPEADKLLWHEQPAVNDGERAMARLNLEGEGFLGEAEARAQRGEPYAERAFRMLEQLERARATILGLYLDALRESPELAERIAREQPWVLECLREAANDSDDTVRQAA